MTAKKADAKPEPAAQPTGPQADDKPGSEEVLVVLPPADEPVRRDGWVLTDDGWKPDTGAGPAGLPPGSEPPATVQRAEPDAKRED